MFERFVIQSPTRDDANRELDAANVDVDEQEARGLAMIQQLKDQNAAKDEAIKALDEALVISRANEVNEELTNKIQTLRANLQNNFVAAQEAANAKVAAARKGR
jgi:hypothetical protein